MVAIFKGRSKPKCSKCEVENPCPKLTKRSRDSSLDEVCNKLLLLLFSCFAIVVRALECDQFASSHSRKEKYPRLRKSVVQQKTPPLGLYRGLNQSEIVKGGPPL